MDSVDVVTLFIIQLYDCYNYLGPGHSPRGCPQGNPDTLAVGHVPEARASSIYSPRSQRPYLPKDSSPPQSILFLQSCLITPYLQSPLTFESFLLHLEGQLASRTRLFVYTFSLENLATTQTETPRDTLWKAVAPRQTPCWKAAGTPPAPLRPIGRSSARGNPKIFP
jgi:hypothetical protein